MVSGVVRVHLMTKTGVPSCMLLHRLSSVLNPATASIPTPEATKTINNVPLRLFGKTNEKSPNQNVAKFICFKILSFQQSVIERGQSLYYMVYNFNVKPTYVLRVELKSMFDEMLTFTMS